MSGDQANDEHSGTLIPTAAGRFAYVARASVDGGETWTVCDFGGDSCGGAGSDDGFGDPGTLTVD